jgi:hypothetical protein
MKLRIRNGGSFVAAALAGPAPNVSRIAQGHRLLRAGAPLETTILSPPILASPQTEFERLAHNSRSQFKEEIIPLLTEFYAGGYDSGARASRFPHCSERLPP